MTVEDERNVPAEILPPFTGDKPRCAKCHYDSASTSYYEFGRCFHPNMANEWGLNPRMHRECSRCSYQWDEALPEEDA